MELAQRHKILIAPISVFAVLFIFGGITVFMKSDAEEIKVEKEISSVRSLDNSIDAPNKSQKVAEPESNTITPFINPGRNRIVAAITVGVLYQQGILTTTDSATVVDDEERN